jgi:hypothetical protein
VRVCLAIAKSHARLLELALGLMTLAVAVLCTMPVPCCGGRHQGAVRNFTSRVIRAWGCRAELLWPLLDELRRDWSRLTMLYSIHMKYLGGQLVALARSGTGPSPHERRLHCPHVAIKALKMDVLRSLPRLQPSRCCIKMSRGFCSEPQSAIPLCWPYPKPGPSS